MAKPEKVRLGELLVQQGLLTTEQLTAALADQKRTGKKLGRVFVDNKYVTEDQISHALSKQLNLPYINLKNYDLNQKTVQTLSETYARRFRSIVLKHDGAELLVGTSDPTDIYAYDELTNILKGNISFAVVTESEVLHAIDRMYRRTSEITGLAKELEKELGSGPVDFGSAATTPGMEDAPVVKLLQSVFDDATQVRASDVHIEPQSDRLVIRFRIDGMLHLQTESDIKIAPALALRLKLMSDLDISEKRLPQDGRFVIKVRQQSVDVRISILPTKFGESIVMRLLNQSGGALNLDKIGMPEWMLKRFRAAIHRPNGLILVTGPTGSGKTTTLYSALSELNTPSTKLITVEDPVEYTLNGINQVQVNEKIDLTFAKVLRSALRQDPDVVLVGEMRDQDTATIGMRAAMTGHLVLSTLHTNDAASTPIRLMDMGIARYMVATSVQVVLAQRLVRVICEGCSEEHTLDAMEEEWLAQELGDDVNKYTYRKGRGCSRCNGTGYAGRTGVYEMLEMTESLAKTAYDPDPSAFIQGARIQMQGKTMRSHVAALIAKGITSVEEGIRLNNQVED